MQNGTLGEGIGVVIPKAAFLRLVQEIMNTNHKGHKVPQRWAKKAVEALQVGAESFLTKLMKDSYFCSLCCGRSTLYGRDLQLVNHITSNYQTPQPTFPMATGMNNRVKKWSKDSIVHFSGREHQYTTMLYFKTRDEVITDGEKEDDSDEEEYKP